MNFSRTKNVGRKICPKELIPSLCINHSASDGLPATMPLKSKPNHRFMAVTIIIVFQWLNIGTFKIKMENNAIAMISITDKIPALDQPLFLGIKGNPA